MVQPFLSVREIQPDDINSIADYWLTASPGFLTGMGVDRSKMPTRNEWTDMLNEQLSTPLPEKKSYCIIWLADSNAIGHCNVNKIVFGEEAYMHLHLWNNDERRKGYGVKLVKLSLPYFFHNLHLKRLFCEPYALNVAPNITLQKLGFELIDEYTTTPGWINFEQPVKLWQLSYNRFVSGL